VSKYRQNTFRPKEPLEQHAELRSRPVGDRCAESLFPPLKDPGRHDVRDRAPQEDLRAPVRMLVVKCTLDGAKPGAGAPSGGAEGPHAEADALVLRQIASLVVRAAVIESVAPPGDEFERDGAACPVEFLVPAILHMPRLCLPPDR
jgi:hypothetical protein